jgi:hypothetical protein
MSGMSLHQIVTIVIGGTFLVLAAVVLYAILSQPKK